MIIQIWRKVLQDALTAAKDAFVKESQTAVDSAKDTLNAAIDALVQKTPDAQKEVYDMNIPYADFYKADGVVQAQILLYQQQKQKTRATAAGSIKSIDNKLMMVTVKIRSYIEWMTVGYDDYSGL